jgi:hypothetical protein
MTGIRHRIFYRKYFISWQNESTYLIWWMQFNYYKFVLLYNCTSENEVNKNFIYAHHVLMLLEGKQ